ncbi:MAG: LPS export ABC transporter periplasmic protein LptC [Helicobacteraceae bacterium]|jgi:LPS export ABC transporter protein LptC|nr:LPS export ABC transporter periplasmic protein LptC [Helicobacteraceae bacterium]
MAISANYFFIAIGLLLTAILLFFQPIPIKDTMADNVNVAELELRNFTLYELGSDGLKDIMIGHYGFRYTDRIEVEEIDYTDNAGKQRNNLQADFGVYNNKDLITLEGNVRYYREDGMKFRSNVAVINQVDESITAAGPFTMNKFSDNVVGTDLFYDTKNGLTRAKDVTSIFTLTE